MLKKRQGRRKLEDFGETSTMVQPGWLVLEATERTKATFTREPVLLEMPIDYNGSPCFFSANLLVPKNSYCLAEADKTEFKDATDRDAIVTWKSKRSTEVETDKNSSQAVWKKPEDKPGRIYLNRRLARRVRRAQRRQGSHGGRREASRILAAHQGNSIPWASR